MKEVMDQLLLEEDLRCQAEQKQLLEQIILIVTVTFSIILL